jgi:lambda repressor-like predicted transcriptional regulator
MKNNKDKTREAKAALIMKGITLSSIAVELGVSRQYISNVLNGNNTTRRVQRVIARKAGMRVDDLFSK